MSVTVVLCIECVESIGSQIEFTIADVSPAPAGAQIECQVCSAEDPSLYKITKVILSKSIEIFVSEQIHGCQAHGCAVMWDSVDKETVGDSTNSYVSEVIRNHLDESKYDKIQPYIEILKHIIDEGREDIINASDLQCGACGGGLETYDRAKIRRVYRVKPELPRLPPEIMSIVSTLALPAQIEYHRSDSSNYLIHLTKPNDIATKWDNIDDQLINERLGAASILWLILKEKRIRAHQGIGMKKASVCFTEKPIQALKDTLVGVESQIRKRSRAIEWHGYGLMFKKHHLQKQGIKPVIHLPVSEHKKIPCDLQHLLVSFDSNNETSWVHEREWRTVADVVIDPAECIVLVPIFEHIAPFRTALESIGISVKGFLPLLDIFAFC